MIGRERIEKTGSDGAKEIWEESTKKCPLKKGLFGFFTKCDGNKCGWYHYSHFEKSENGKVVSRTIIGECAILKSTIISGEGLMMASKKGEK